MFKLYAKTEYSHLSTKTIGFFEKKEDAEKLMELLSKKTLNAFSRVRMSKDVFKRVINVQDLITKKEKDSDYIIANVDNKTLDEILVIIQKCGKRSMNHFFFDSPYSLKKTISKNNLSKIEPDLAKNIAKAIIYFDKKSCKSFDFAIKEVILH